MHIPIISNILRAILPHQDEDPQSRHFKVVVYNIIGFTSLMVVTALAVFFMNLEGDEQTLVPNVVGSDLVTALIALQEKELVPRIQQRYSDSPLDKGTILVQDPGPGMIVRVGRRINLVVSRGAIVDRVENFIGQNLSEVRIHLQTLSTTQQPLLRIQDDPIYIHHESAPGTILEQNPAPGSEISELTTLELVVSRGPRGQMERIANYVGLRPQQAVEQLARRNASFQFTLRDREGNEGPGQVVSQNPAAGVDAPQGTPVQLVLTRPQSVPAGQHFGLLEHILPDYPILVDLKVTHEPLEGEPRDLLVMRHPGGRFSMPYQLPIGDSLVISIFNREVITYTITGN